MRSNGVSALFRNDPSNRDDTTMREREKTKPSVYKLRPSTKEELVLMKQEIEKRADRSLTFDAFFDTLTSNSDWIVDAIAENMNNER